MKTYSFSNIRVMGMPNMCDLRNPYIFSEGIRHIINVCENEYPRDVLAAIDAKGIKRYHFSISEEAGAQWDDTLMAAVEVLKGIHDKGESAIVHCTCGNNRSRSVVEAFHYFLTGVQMEDEYKGFPNHFLYNVSLGHISEDLLNKR